MPLYRLDFRAMASPCEVQLWCDDAAEAALALEAARDEVQRIESKYSRYRDDSVVGAINRAHGGAAVEVDAETAALLDFAAQAHADSEGRFDITSGVLRGAWDFKSGRLPNPAAIEALLPLIGWNQVEWRAPYLRLPRPGMALDFGGFGKEYAADRAAAALGVSGHRHALVNLGGDVRVLGPQANGRPWLIGIQHPRRADAVLAQIEIDAGAVATSGDYERYFELDGRRYSHLLDPRTGWPVAAAQSATVVAPLCVFAGACATIALLHGARGEAYLERAGVRYLWVDAAGAVRGDIALL
jgi:thiamine biosynthesis lipoprotein